jgi:hypothetical protein
MHDIGVIVHQGSGGQPGAQDANSELVARKHFGQFREQHRVLVKS